MATRTKGDDEMARRLMDGLLNEIDEERARGLRERYGRNRWVLSWGAEGGAWLAKISGPGRGETIECLGKTRVDAIERAATALQKSLSSS